MISQKSAAAAGLVVLLAGCQQMPGMEGGGGIPGMVSADGDACGAAGRQGLIGTSVGGLDAASLPENRRVIFPGMAVTMDFQPDRLNVEVGGDDEVARVYCG